MHGRYAEFGYGNGRARCFDDRIVNIEEVTGGLIQVESQNQ